MKINTEVAIGILVIITALGIISAVTGIYGILYLGVTVIITIISLNLFLRKSLVAKTGAVILNTDIIFKLLMPSKYKKAIKELEKREKNEKT